MRTGRSDVAVTSGLSDNRVGVLIVLIVLRRYEYTRCMCNDEPLTSTALRVATRFAKSRVAMLSEAILSVVILSVAILSVAILRVSVAILRVAILVSAWWGTHSSLIWRHLFHAGVGCEAISREAILSVLVAILPQWWGTDPSVSSTNLLTILTILTR